MAEKKAGCMLALLGLFGGGKAAAVELPYALEDQLLTNAEVSFYHVLARATGAAYAVCPKVRLADILSITVKGGGRMSAFNRISAKHVDFLLCDPQTMKPVLAVELDDSSHGSSHRAQRDEFVDSVYRAVGLPVLHMSVRRGYSLQEIEAAIAEALGDAAPTAEAEHAEGTRAVGPVCPKCGVEMVLRTAAKGKNKGSSFYGCPNYPRCREVLPAPGPEDRPQ